jgi:hypothetical protein
MKDIGGERGAWPLPYVCHLYPYPKRMFIWGCLAWIGPVLVRKNGTPASWGCGPRGRVIISNDQNNHPYQPLSYFPAPEGPRFQRCSCPPASPANTSAPWSGHITGLIGTNSAALLVQVPEVPHPSARTAACAEGPSVSLCWREACGEHQRQEHRTEYAHNRSQGSRLADPAGPF